VGIQKTLSIASNAVGPQVGLTLKKLLHIQT